MKKRILFCMALVAVFLVGAPRTAAQDGQKCGEKGGMWDEATQQCRMATTVQINIDYPMFVTQYGFAEQAVDEFLQTARASLLEPDPLYEPYIYSFITLTIGYEVYQFSPTIISLKFDIFTGAGGTSYMNTFQTFTFDLTTQRTLTIEDLFLPGGNPLAVIAPLVQQDLQNQLGDMANVSWIQEGTAPDPANYSNFAVTPDSLIFYFQPYQVGSYFDGLHVSIPLSTLSGMLGPPFSN
jgi:hypothetical protein